MKKLHVIYNGWGEHWPLGTLLDTGPAILFEYAREAVERGLQLSPLHHPLPRTGAAAVTFRGEPAFGGLPSFIADSLPDGWGMLLMDRALRRAGRDPAAVSVLERLAVVGERAIGALSFEPAQEDAVSGAALQLRDIARWVVELQAEDGVSTAGTQQALLRLLQLGGSPQGARPKVLLDVDPGTGAISSGGRLAGEVSPWLVKFPAQGEPPQVCALEELYARIARQGGLDMPQSRFFDLDAQHSAFGVKRFDRMVVDSASGDKALVRVPVMSLSAMLAADHRMPSLDYETVLLAAVRVTGDQRELLKAFERCVYNVLLHNRDDHSRNFAFRLDAQGFWKLAPVFDLTLSSGPGGEHATSVLGHGSRITRTQLLELAKRAGIESKAAQACISTAVDNVRQWQQQVVDLPLRPAMLVQLRKTLDETLVLME